jgi:hypothetical protein
MDPPLSQPIAGLSLVFLIVDIFVYWILVILIEAGFFNWIVKSVKRMFAR